MAQNKNIIHTFSCRRDNCFSVKMVIKVLGYLLLACPWSVPINGLIVLWQHSAFRRWEERKWQFLGVVLTSATCKIHNEVVVPFKYTQNKNVNIHQILNIFHSYQTLTPVQTWFGAGIRQWSRVLVLGLLTLNTIFESSLDSTQTIF